MSWVLELFNGLVSLTRRKPKPLRFNRNHYWQMFGYRHIGGARTWVAFDPPICTYCRQEQTLANEYAPCPGPPVERQQP